MPETLGQDLLNKRRVKLGIIGVSVAAENTAYDSAAGWSDLGVMDPGSFNPSFPRDVFELKLGFPRATKMEAITGTSGMIDFVLTEYSPYAAEVASGSGAGTRTYATTPAATTFAAGTHTVTGAALTSGAGAAVGQLVELTLPSGATHLAHLETVSGVNVTWLPAAPVAPVAAAAFKYVKRITQAQGTVEIPKFAFKAVFVDQWGERIGLYMGSCSFPEGYTPNFGDATSNAKLPMKAKAYGQDATWLGKTQQIVGYIYHDMAGVS